MRDAVLFEAIAQQAWISNPAWFTELRQWLATEPALVHARQADGSTPLHRAFAYPWLVQALLSYGADADARNEAGLTPLYYAAKWVRADVMALLIEHGASTNVVDEEGKTPLHWAVLRGRRDVVQPLLQTSADKSAVDMQGKTPLLLAQETGKTELVELLC